jgi:hypothetical protein
LKRLSPRSPGTLPLARIGVATIARPAPPNTRAVATCANAEELPSPSLSTECHVMIFAIILRLITDRPVRYVIPRKGVCAERQVYQLLSRRNTDYKRSNHEQPAPCVSISVGSCWLSSRSGDEFVIYYDAKSTSASKR